MNRAPDEDRSQPDRGFVIVGVVMFVLALTILGLSLFGLSGYESEFTMQAIDGEQAYFSAASGIEHAKFVLATQESLGAVGNTALFPDANLLYARARRTDTDDTLGSIVSLDMDTPIEIRSMAQVRGERRMIQAQYVRSQSPNLYKRLITAAEYVYVKPVDAGLPLYSTMDSPLSTTAGVWHKSLYNPASWTSNTAIDPSRVHVAQSIVAPQLTPYFAKFEPIAHEINGVDFGVNGRRFDLNLNGGTHPDVPNDVEFFKTIQDPSNDGVDQAESDAYSVMARLRNVLIDLHGNGPKTAVWLMDHGLRTNQGLTFDFDPGDMLVIVSWSSGVLGLNNLIGLPIHAAGIWFFAGLHSQNLPVILVSAGQIIIEQTGAPNAQFSSNYLTLFGQSVWLGGTLTAATPTMWLHPAGHPNDAPNGPIDRLWEFGALPNAEAGTRFQSVAGTWTELNPDQPDPLSLPN